MKSMATNLNIYRIFGTLVPHSPFVLEYTIAIPLPILDTMLSHIQVPMGYCQLLSMAIGKPQSSDPLHIPSYYARQNLIVIQDFATTLNSDKIDQVLERANA